MDKEEEEEAFFVEGGRLRFLCFVGVMKRTTEQIWQLIQKCYIKNITSFNTFLLSCPALGL